MRVPVRALRVGGMLAAAAGVIAGTAPAAGADNEAGQIVHVVKDQGGGAYYNVVTGERFDVTATSAVTTLSGFGVQAASGIVLTDLGQILLPVNGVTDPTPAATVVQVVETTALATYQDATTGALYAIRTVGQTIPAGNELALKLATKTILTINNKVLIPIEHATGLDHH